MSVVTETKTSDGDGYRKTHTTITTTTTLRQTASPRNLVITRTSGGLLGSPSTSMTSRTTTRSLGAGPAEIGDFASGEYQLKTAHGVSEVKSSRDQEKKELQDLNERFSNYLDKVWEIQSVTVILCLCSFLVAYAIFSNKKKNSLLIQHISNE
jgi:hypothetical protein